MTGQTFIHRVTGIKEGTTDDILKNVLSRKTLAQRIARENTEKSIQTIDRMIEENREGLLNVDLLRRAQEEARRALNSTTMAAKIGVLAPVGFFGLSEGLHAPDLDISLLVLIVFQHLMGVSLQLYSFSKNSYISGPFMHRAI
jgi:hypothetical protein